MTKKEYYMEALVESGDRTAYLLENSRLPGPRANLELMQAYVELGSEKDFIPLLDHTPDQAPENTPEAFLAVCGTVGLGELIANGLIEYLPDLRRQASDPRWRVREAVALALQIIGRHDFHLLSSICSDWVSGSFLEQRALVAGSCEPELLTVPEHARLALQWLDRITRSLSGVENRRDDDFRVLRKGLGYCWSVAVVANPEYGKPIFEKLFELDDGDVRWIIRENLKKNRMVKMDTAWASALSDRFQTPSQSN
jgi:hypothetical protein